MAYYWNGRIYSKNMRPDHKRARLLLMLAAESHDWDLMFEIQAETRYTVNCWKLDEFSFNTPLHHAAEANAPVEVIEKLIKLGAWRSLKNAEGYSACDIAFSKGHYHIFELLRPVPFRPVDEFSLEMIQKNLHQVINYRVESLLKRDPQRLPEVSVILDLRTPELWFPINGMYGGFSLRFNLSDQPALIAASWCRVVGGSGEKHLITAEAITLIDSGFV